MVSKQNEHRQKYTHDKNNTEKYIHNIEKPINNHNEHNDSSNYDRHYKQEMAKYRNAVRNGLIDLGSDAEKDYKFCDPEYWLGLANTMKEDASAVFDRLQANFTGSKIVYMGIVRNPKWCDETMLMCDNFE